MSSSFRELYADLLRLPDDVEAWADHLRDRQQPAADCLAAMASLRIRTPRLRPRDAEQDDLRQHLFSMYALSRIGDLLLEAGCPAGEPPPGLGVTGGRAVIPGSVADRFGWSGGSRSDASPGWHVSRRLELAWLAVRREFLTGIGLRAFEHGDAFSPFHHEVFAVVPDPAATTVSLQEVLWPGFWFGTLLVSRAGVQVRAPRHLVDPEVATTSTLYFTHRRQPRPVNDQAQGWGSNSQWGTAFPRFYADDDGLHLNWDGGVDIGDDPPRDPRGVGGDDVPLDERRELLLHRCFVRRDLPRDEDDRYPYTDRLTLREAAWPLRPESILAR